ncbi:MAG: VWA domain-containing protein [Anaerolineales bacterium]|nr:VWA domain-containing protein [Anaerolineales bacterium]
MQPETQSPLTSTEHGHLLRNMVLFGRMLRALGVPVRPTQILDLVEAVGYITVRSREDFKNTARTILVSKFEHLPLFDRAFDLFWQARTENELVEMNLGALLPSRAKHEKKVEVTPNKGSSDQESNREADEPLIDTIYTYSAKEVLRRKDFAELTPEELDEIKLMMQRMEWRLEQRRTRRKVRTSRGAYLDLRRSFRHNLRYGGEPLQLTWRERKLKRRPLVVIADISGSMERYSRVLLKFIYSISNGLDNVEAFVFGTRLTRITRYLREKNIDMALDQVTASVHDWAGGTRIGDALKTFNYEWGRRVLGQGAIVLIISDGWDRGDIDLLGREMNRLQLSSQRLIWLNPLLGSENYEPLTRGIQAALPYIDDFLPVHNLVSLEQLGHLLERLGEHKPARRHHVTS